MSDVRLTAARSPLSARPRRVVLQLMPLLDLLLIVIFAQYLDVSERDQLRTQQTERANREARAALERASIAEQERVAAIDLADASRQAATRAQNDAAVARQDRRRTLAAVADIFQLEEAERAELIGSAAMAANGSDEAARIRERLASLTRGDPDAVRLHLRTHEELRRLADVWRLHLDPDGVLHLIAGGGETTRRLTAAPFVPEVFAWSKEQPQAKTLVLLLLSYDERARLLEIRNLRAAMPNLVERLRRDTESKVDFADLGYQTLPTTSGASTSAVDRTESPRRPSA